VAVGVLVGKHILAVGQWVPVPVIRKEANPELLVPVARAALVGNERILGQGVRLVPAERLILVRPLVLLRELAGWRRAVVGEDLLAAVRAADLSGSA